VIGRSHWAARAWTFQEGYLAKRRLVFTEEQVYYECGGMYSAESLDVPLAKIHGPDGQILDTRFIKVQPDSKIVVFPGSVGHAALKVFGCIIDYSSRSLTYPSDRLTGFWEWQRRSRQVLIVFVIFEARISSLEASMAVKQRRGTSLIPPSFFRQCLGPPPTLFNIFHLFSAGPGSGGVAKCFSNTAAPRVH
jgi:hypothetical protein